METEIQETKIYDFNICFTYKKELTKQAIETLKFTGEVDSQLKITLQTSGIPVLEDKTYIGVINSSYNERDKLRIMSEDETVMRSALRSLRLAKVILVWIPECGDHTLKLKFDSKNYLILEKI